jgi:hypothetical protein
MDRARFITHSMSIWSDCRLWAQVVLYLLNDDLLVNIQTRYPILDFLCGRHWFNVYVEWLQIHADASIGYRNELFNKLNNLDGLSVEHEQRNLYMLEPDDGESTIENPCSLGVDILAPGCSSQRISYYPRIACEFHALRDRKFSVPQPWWGEQR